MYTLYIDTHYTPLVIALYKDNEVIEIKELNSNLISEDTIPIIIKVLEECNIKVNDLQEIIVISGPGSFTGVRIGIVISKILSYTLNIPVKSLSYLEAMSLNYNYPVSVGIKDRNGVFVGEFSNNSINYYYIKNNELEDKDIIFDTTIDLIKVKKYMKDKESINPHNLVPLYIKNLEVNHD